MILFVVYFCSALTEAAPLNFTSLTRTLRDRKANALA